MTFDEKLREILEKHCCGWEAFRLQKGSVGTNIVLDTAIFDIKKLIVESLPEKHLVKGTPGERVYWESVGYNQPIEDMKAKFDIQR